MLAAKSLGVASIAQAALARHPQFTRQFFGLPEDRRIVCGISFGFEDPAHPANQFASIIPWASPHNQMDAYIGCRTRR